MRNRRLTSIALFSGSFFLLLVLLASTRLYAIPGSLSSGGNTTGASTLSTGTATPFPNGSRHAAPNLLQHSRMYGKAGHSDRHHFETDLFAGANKAGAPAASQALTSE